MVDWEVNYPAFGLWVRRMLGSVIGDLEFKAYEMAYETERVHARTMGEAVRQAIKRPFTALRQMARRTPPLEGGG